MFATKRLWSALAIGLLSLACKTPVVFHGLNAAGNDGSSPAVSPADLAALVRYHARSAVAAASAGRIDDARAHWEAHEALRALPDGQVIETGVALKELASLSALLESDEMETDVEASGSGTPEALRTGQDGPTLQEDPPSVPAKATRKKTPPIPRKTTRKQTELAATALPSPRADQSARSSPPRPALASKAWLQNEVRRILSEFGEGRAVELPKSFLDKVDRAVKDFTKGNRRLWFSRALQRMDKYLPAIHGIFSERRLPESFYYLALVESAFNPNARSSAGAVGLWQFMPATARRYGLTVRRGRDERRDPRKATRAAREYLLDLILEFGDGHSMLLAMAAYNAGEGRVRNRLRRLSDYRNRSFWTLDQKRLLPAETRRYVPTIIAAAVVGRNRSRFGLAASRPSSGVATVVLRRPVSIPYILRAAQMAKASLLALNPELEAGSGVTPAETAFPLVLPRDVAVRLRRDPVLVTAQQPPPIQERSPIEAERSAELYARSDAAEPSSRADKSERADVSERA
ncbi:MAG: lytic transglycosylase domain-containing protein, partial [Myxococcota bacterium]